MNDADVDHGPTWPWYSARACHVYRFLKSSWVLTLKDGLLIRPESCTLAPESLKISKRYWNATVSVRNFRVAGLAVNSLRWEMLHSDDFVLTPLPNHLFQRDNSAWIYRGVSINPMAMPARVRESVHSAAIYRLRMRETESGQRQWSVVSCRNPREYYRLDVTKEELGASEGDAEAQAGAKAADSEFRNRRKIH